jgi:hypothetical protein
MVRGYDQLFANRLLGALLVFAALLLITGICVWGSLYFKRMVKQDEEDRRQIRGRDRDST